MAPRVDTPNHRASDSGLLESDGAPVRDPVTVPAPPLAGGAADGSPRWLLLVVLEGVRVALRVPDWEVAGVGLAFMDLDVELEPDKDGVGEAVAPHVGTP